MGVGDPLEAGYRLKGPLPAGTYHLVGDGIVFESVDMRFDLVWREGGQASAEHPIVSFTHHFDALAGDAKFTNAIAFEADAEGAAVPSTSNDLLVLRFSVTSQHPTGSNQYLPNGDGELYRGRIPSIRIPQ